MGGIMEGLRENIKFNLSYKEKVGKEFFQMQIYRQDIIGIEFKINVLTCVSINLVYFYLGCNFFVIRLYLGFFFREFVWQVEKFGFFLRDFRELLKVFEVGNNIIKVMFQ